MFKSLMAMAAVAAFMTFGASNAEARYGHAPYGGGYYAGNYGAGPCGTACGPVCPRRTTCTNYQSGYYRDCLPRYVAGDCMQCPVNTCRTGCW